MAWASNPATRIYGVPRERRSARRFPYPATVRIDPPSRRGFGAASYLAAGLDISTSGIAVLLDHPLVVGDVVTVTLGGGFGSPDEISAGARVARVAIGGPPPSSDDPAPPRGFVVGLEFLG